MATLLGAALLLADSTNDCASYQALQTSFDFTADCPFLPSQGHASLNFPAQGSDGLYTDRSLAIEQLTAQGLGVSTVELDFTGDCSGGKGEGRINSMAISLGSAGATVFRCTRIPLPLTQSQAVTCERVAGADAALPQSDAQERDSGATDVPGCTISFQAVK